MKKYTTTFKVKKGKPNEYHVHQVFDTQIEAYECFVDFMHYMRDGEEVTLCVEDDGVSSLITMVKCVGTDVRTMTHRTKIDFK